jgi:hypothetical protein
MDISIKKPCHENWDNMTPNEQGAFCHKCVKNVIDFSEKTVEEIKAFFTMKKENERVCGRFTGEQMTELSFDAWFRRFRKFSLVKKMAVVLFFTFGLSLFGSGRIFAQSLHLKGDVAVERPVMKQGKVKAIKKDTVFNETIKKPVIKKSCAVDNNKQAQGDSKKTTKQPAAPPRKSPQQLPPAKGEVIITNKE